MPECAQGQKSARVMHDVDKVRQGFSEPWGSRGALRLWWGNSLPPRWCNTFARNVMKLSRRWPAGSGSRPLWVRSRNWLGRAGGGHPASPAAGRREAPHSCTSCCTDAPCLCYCGREDTDRTTLDDPQIQDCWNAGEGQVRKTPATLICQPFFLFKEPV